MLCKLHIRGVKIYQKSKKRFSKQFHDDSSTFNRPFFLILSKFCLFAKILPSSFLEFMVRLWKRSECYISEILNFFRFKILFSFSFLWISLVSSLSCVRTLTLSLPCKVPYMKVMVLEVVVSQLATIFSIFYSSDSADFAPDLHSSSYLALDLPFLDSGRPHNVMNFYGSPKSCNTQKC